MEVLIYLIVMIVFCGVVISKSAKNAGNNKNKNGQQGMNSYKGSYPNAQQGMNSYNGNYPNAQQGNIPRTQMPSTQNNASQRPQQTPVQKSKAVPMHTPGSSQPSMQPLKKEMTTVEYLADKAQKEEMSQKQASFDENKARNGNIQLAMRIPDSGMVPAGFFVKKCSYCGAENMLKHGERRLTLCYFCQTKM